MKYLDKIDISNKNVLVRLDLDVPVTGGKIIDDVRLLDTFPTVKFLLEKQANVTIIGHVGRPQKTKNKEQKAQFQIEPVRKWYTERFPGAKLFVAENLRFEAGEEANSPDFAKDIVRRFHAQIYVFDAFASSHDQHTSIVQIPRLLPTVVGFRFQAEIEHLQPVLSNPKRPLIFVVGGAKAETKIPLVEKLLETADEILAGGTLPLEINPKGGKLIVAKLIPDSLDIAEKSAKFFIEKIKNAGTVVWNGPMGAYENRPIDKLTNRQIDKWKPELKNTPAYGTYLVAEAMRQTNAYTVVGGGDTEAALSVLGGTVGIDWISSGGGAMLHYLAYGTLPFLEALTKERN